MEKPYLEHMFLMYKHNMNSVPFALNNNHLNSMASNFFMEKIIHVVWIQNILFAYCTSASVTSLPLYKTAECIVFFSMVNKPQEIIHSIFLFHKPYQLHMNTNSSFISMLNHLFHCPVKE